MSNSKNPEVGMGATIGIGSDRYGATIIKMTKCTVTVQYDTATPGTGHNYYDNQVWEHKPNPNGAIKTFHRNSDGNFVNGSYYLSVGARDTYSDPHF